MEKPTGSSWQPSCSTRGKLALAANRGLRRREAPTEMCARVRAVVFPLVRARSYWPLGQVVSHNGSDSSCAEKLLDFEHSSGSGSNSRATRVKTVKGVPFWGRRDRRLRDFSWSLTTGSLVGRAAIRIAAGLMYSLIFSKPLNRVSELELHVIAPIENCGAGSVWTHMLQPQCVCVKVCTRRHVRTPRPRHG
jgi:hypothetical protein